MTRKKKRKIIENLKIGPEGLSYDTKIKETEIINDHFVEIKYLKLKRPK